MAIRIDIRPFTTNFNTWSGTVHCEAMLGSLGYNHYWVLIELSIRWGISMSSSGNSQVAKTSPMIWFPFINSPISSHFHQQAASSWAISHLSLADMDLKLMPLLIDANSITWSKIRTKKAHKNCTWKSVCLSLCFLHDLEHQTEGFFFQLHFVQVLAVFMLFLHATKQLSNYANTIKWASLTKWVLSNLTSPSCMAIIYMNWKHYLLTRVFITWMVEGLHLNGTRSLQLTKTSSEWGGAFKCKEKKP